MTEPLPIEVSHVGSFVDIKNNAVHKLVENNSKFQHVSSEAKVATDIEHAMTLREAIRRYPKAIGWSILLSAAIAMEGYDSVLCSQFLAFPTFVERYGVLEDKGETYAISAAWQAGLGNGARVGEILGLLLNGLIAERFGFKKTMLGSLVLLCALIFIPFFAPNIATLEAGQILLGIPWGVFQTLTTAYAAEVCPVALRAYLTSYVNLMWGVGQLVASGVLRGFLSRTDEWSYRIPFALQWVWPIPLIIGISFAPESPWWLVRQSRIDDARAALNRLSSTSLTEIDHAVSLMRYTNELEQKISAGTTYIDCFRGVNLRRTEITCIAWLIQSASGASLMGYAAYFFEQAGLHNTISFDFSMSLYAVAMISVIVSWFAMTYFGRRTIYLAGLSGMFLILLSIGFTSLASTATSSAPSYAIGSLLLLFTLFYDVGVGTVAYSVVAEMPSTRLRTKTIVLARNLYNFQGIVNGVITPYMLNQMAWNWKGKAGFFWAGTCFLCLTWSFFRLPEPKGRTYGELDILFEQGVSARKFRSTIVDAFDIVNNNLVEVVTEEKRQEDT